MLITGGMGAFALSQSGPAGAAEAPVLSLKKSVRRVILDITVTDPDGKPVPGLTQKDFVIKEDKKKQRILSFEVHEVHSSRRARPLHRPHRGAGNSASTCARACQRQCSCR
jgi:hypothetical protein